MQRGRKGTENCHAAQSDRLVAYEGERGKGGKRKEATTKKSMATTRCHHILCYVTNTSHLGRPGSQTCMNGCCAQQDLTC
jgi:hypothetical protein